MAVHNQHARLNPHALNDSRLSWTNYWVPVSDTPSSCWASPVGSGNVVTFAPWWCRSCAGWLRRRSTRAARIGSPGIRHVGDVAINTSRTTGAQRAHPRATDVHAGKSMQSQYSPQPGKLNFEPCRITLSWIRVRSMLPASGRMRTRSTPFVRPTWRKIAYTLAGTLSVLSRGSRRHQ